MVSEQRMIDNSSMFIILKCALIDSIAQILTHTSSSWPCRFWRPPEVAELRSFPVTDSWEQWRIHHRLSKCHSIYSALLLSLLYLAEPSTLQWHFDWRILERKQVAYQPMGYYLQSCNSESALHSSYRSGMLCHQFWIMESKLTYHQRRSSSLE